MWRAEAGEFPGSERITYGSVGVGPGGKAIEFKLLAPSKDVDQLLAATESIKDRLGDFTGVYDIADDNTPGNTSRQPSIAACKGLSPRRT